MTKPKPGKPATPQTPPSPGAEQQQPHGDANDKVSPASSEPMETDKSENAGSA